MRLFLIIFFACLITAFFAAGAFEGGKGLQQQHMERQEMLRKLT